MEKKTTDLFRKASAKRSERHPLDNFKPENNDQPSPVYTTEKKVEIEAYNEPLSEKPVRQSFLLDWATMEKIKDIVYFERRNGNFEYSQKDAITDGILALLEKRGDVPERPSEERAKERNRSERIKKGRRKKRY